jgi:hypothetical protein
MAQAASYTCSITEWPCDGPQGKEHLMTRIILAAAAALALVSAAPAFACPDCHDCPQHKDKVASADQAEKKDADKADKSAKDKKVACHCSKDGNCKCGSSCQCAHEHEKGEKKAEKKS